MKIHLRSETKPLEHRTALTPSIAKILQDAGFEIFIEESSQSIFEISEYSSLGLKIVPKDSWKNACKDTIIIGLKELLEEDFNLKNTHIMFAHCFKNQMGWEKILNRFVQGNGLLLDLEFLVNDAGRRVAAFGYYAGYAGAAVGLATWANKILGVSQPPIHHYNNDGELISYTKNLLDEATKIIGRLPKILIIGALGRCGTGACDFISNLGISESVHKWDIAETKVGGPFPFILDVDIFINCIYLDPSIPTSPFLTMDMLNSQMNLSVIVDVSCDWSNPMNPIPIYNECTTFDKPCYRVKNTNIDVISIDHLPSLLPREASEAFGKDLLESLLGLKRYVRGKKGNVKVWENAEELFEKKCQVLK